MGRKWFKVLVVALGSIIFATGGAFGYQGAKNYIASVREAGHSAGYLRGYEIGSGEGYKSGFSAGKLEGERTSTQPRDSPILTDTEVKTYVLKYLSFWSASLGNPWGNAWAKVTWLTVKYMGRNEWLVDLEGVNVEPGWRRDASWVWPLHL